MTSDRLSVRRFVLVALILPAAIVLSGLAIQVVVLPTLPDPVAIHWGTSGAPNGFGPAWITVLLTVVVGLGFPALIAVSALSSMRRGDRGFAYRLLGAVALGVAVLMTVLGTWTLVLQSGLEDAADGPSVLVPLAVSFAVAVLSGILGWLVQPHEPWRPVAVVPTEAVPLAPGERAVWLQRVSIARSGATVLVAALVLMVVLTTITLVLTPDPVATWVMIGATLLIAALVLTTLAFHVRVDDEGLTINSVAGWPRAHVPLDDIDRAAVVEVNPMGQFGGWGMRWGPAGFGVVLRAGEGIEVRRRSGKTLTVTVDDAATGAALLNALATRVG